MKTAVFLSAASLAAAFVVPGNDQQLLSALSKDVAGIAPAAEEVVLPPSQESPKERLGHHHHHHHHEGDLEKEKEGSLVESIGNAALKLKWRGVAGFVKGLERGAKHFEEIDLEWLERLDEGEMKKDKKKYDGKGKKHHKDLHSLDDFDIPGGHHGHHRGFFSKAIHLLKHMLGFGAPKFESSLHQENATSTIYEQISTNKHTRIFTRIINQYDEVVEYLNSTSANYTIFVPIDAAFKGIHDKHHNISKETILHWLEYHISPEVFTFHDFFNVQTVPTLSHEKTKGKFPQRISTSLTRKGLTLNFYSHVIRSDIYATNGIIHAVDKLIIPPLSAKTAIELVPSLFSTLDLALVKTGLIDKLDPSTLKISGTIFAPTNQAFAKLPAKVNAFLFSPVGQKYLKALLKYHVVPGHIVFTDAHYNAKSDDGEESTLISKKQFDLPTYLNKKPIAIDIRNFHRLTLMTVNNHAPVSVPNVPVREGVIHLVSSILIPPHKHNHTDADVPATPINELSIRELVERLEAYVE
ncbi:hypothetical protein EYB26_009161 [Talaromyces marneffei]|uniref:Stabilin-2 n=1 Tax=Talaromyces marneffei PM1 TaxID=1077442 RepID=A0A093UXL7_TALMA|nr:uncharacterized protein EYB26_009161 [Talaromyces marneffei]QGA21450.1 hypothetical protein EYB26_009161 [Talaromyces marneffei]